MNETKPTIIVASHKANTMDDAERLKDSIVKRYPQFEVVVIPQATGVLLVDDSDDS